MSPGSRPLTRSLILVRHSGAEEISVAVLALTGLRVGESPPALRVKRVDLGRHRLTIAGSVTEVGGRPSRTTLKTQHSRSVPFPPSLLEPIGSLGGGQGADDLVFTSPEGLVAGLTVPTCGKGLLHDQVTGWVTRPEWPVWS